MRLRFFTFISLGLVLDLGAIATADFFATARQVFKEDSGGLARPMDKVGDQTKFILVSFWADWCVACKKELELLAEAKDRTGSLTIIAVNVDEEGGFLTAQSFLKKINFPYHSLRDPAGTYFYQASSDGVLPLTLVYTSTGQFVRAYSHFAEDELAALLRESEGFQAPESTRPQQFFDFNAKVKTRKPQSKDERLASVQATTIQYGAIYQSFDLKLSYDALKQVRPLESDKLPSEDELGFSYVQWMDKSGSNWFRNIRLGSDQKVWARGLLMSAKTGPENEVNTRIDGVHSSLRLPVMDVDVFAGELRNQLYAPSLDPSLDLSNNLPRQTFSGVLISRSLSFDQSSSNSKLLFEAGAVKTKRFASEKLGYPEDWADDRVSLGASYRADFMSFSFFSANYRSEDEIQGKSYFSDFSFQLIDRLKFIAAARARELNTDGFSYLTVPELVSEYARPLEDRDQSGYKVGLSWDDSEMAFRPYAIVSWVEEGSLPESARAEFGQKSQTASLVAGLIELSLKTSLVWIQQDLNGPIASQLDEKIFVLTAPTGIEDFGFRAERRDYLRIYDIGSDDLEGFRNGFGVQYGRGMSESFRLILTADFYHQTGFYLVDSGLDHRSMRQVGVSVLNETFKLNMRYGQEPGGIVCTTAGCSYRSGQDGFFGELSVNHSL